MEPNIIPGSSSNENIEREAEDILRHYDDQDFSYSDSVSFTIMKRQKIKRHFLLINISDYGIH